MIKKSRYAFALPFLICLFSIKLFAQKTNDKTGTEPIYHSPGGTYSDWYFPAGDNYLSLEWTFVPIADPPASLAKEGLLHYYAYNFALVNATDAIGGGYAGFQTNGIFMDQSEGKVVNFSIWGSNSGKTEGRPNGLLNPGNTESGGVQIMFKYAWTLKHRYRFELKQGPSGEDASGKWWGLWVTDESTHVKTFIGEQRVPAVIDNKPAIYWNAHTSMFGEDLHWWKSLNGSVKYPDCSAFEPSAMAAIDITANNGAAKPIKFTNYDNSGQAVTGNNGFKSVNCNVSIYRDSLNFNVQHNLGHWASPAPNFIKEINKK